MFLSCTHKRLFVSSLWDTKTDLDLISNMEFVMVELILLPFALPLPLSLLLLLLLPVFRFLSLLADDSRGGAGSSFYTPSALWTRWKGQREVVGGGAEELRWLEFPYRRCDQKPGPEMVSCEMGRQSNNIILWIIESVEIVWERNSLNLVVMCDIRWYLGLASNCWLNMFGFTQQGYMLSTMCVRHMMILMMMVVMVMVLLIGEKYTYIQRSMIGILKHRSTAFPFQNSDDTETLPTQ